MPTITFKELDLQPKRSLSDARHPHGFVSAILTKQSGFGEDDLALFWDAISQMFEHDRSA